MILQDISHGQTIMLEITFGESRIEFNTVIEAVDGNGIYVKPYVYNNTTIDFSALHYDDLKYNVYAMDENNNRNGWKNVNVEIHSLKGHDVYYITAKAYLRLSEASERRDNERLALKNISGFVETSDMRRYQCNINDLSDTGISFITNTGVFLESDIVTVYFYDECKGSRFSLKLKSRIVRVEVREHTSLYACRILAPQREALLYLCLKKMEQKALKIAQEKKILR